MFTGIVEAVGTVASVLERDGVRELRVETPTGFLSGLRVGSSIAVDGACLTPVALDDRDFVVEVVGTTLSRTVVGSYREGSSVNLERAMAVGDRLDGHIMQGHVDGLGKIMSIREDGSSRLIEVQVPKEVYATTLLHGSIALNGVSLTVNRLSEPSSVEVAVIPHTWEVTTFRYLSRGDAVNVEGDLIGKYVGKLLRHSEDRRPGGDEHGV